MDDWGWLLRLALSQKIILEAVGPVAQLDLERDIRAGRFRVPHKRGALFAAAARCSGSCATSSMGTRLRTPTATMPSVLCMLGLPADDAADVVRRPMPKVPEPRTLANA